ncbi:MAG: dihydrolipoyl dehydrogenase [Caldiserica bacterium]|jgi:dihydrolipoamide dehydrogenase|nr:dihydrolipoyl dehydrogenase [Caldisericota bacterium]MDH7563070.1 dihydrolipoyl dehydrogenase [Caldisericota bacterium]
MFDLIVLGGGTAGYVAALYGARKKLNVALVEKDRVGGVCLNRGCIPSKALLSSAEVLEKIKRADEFGIKVEGNIAPSLSQIMERKDRVVGILRRSLESLIKANKVSLFIGEGTVLSKNRVRVGEEILEAKNLLVATGSSPANIPGFEIDGEHVLSTDQILDLREIPEHLIVIGAGAAGCEMATFFGVLGSKVTIIELLPRVLPQEDPDVSRLIEREMRKRGIQLRTGVKVEGMEIFEGGVKVFLSEREELIGTKIFLSVGRVYNTLGFGLQDIGVSLGKKGEISVDPLMRTSVPGVFAAGDVIGGLLLAHVASEEGKTAVDTILGQGKPIDYRKIPWGIFTFPEVGRFGFTEPEAREKFGDVRVGRFSFRSLGKALAISEISGEVKIISKMEDGEILGAHIVGPFAADLVQEISLAVQAGAKEEELKEAIFVHPTLSEAVMEAIHDLRGLSLHKLPGELT